uniref:uncharacterized protein LOC122607774 n=1 Tax=Erigeron canadensis TaxID=72917 RepID=UPI001CB956A2|nr:uncharacterized protein LOC122607774 [Erigeron canadensis]
MMVLLLVYSRSQASISTQQSTEVEGLNTKIAKLNYKLREFKKEEEIKLKTQNEESILSASIAILKNRVEMAKIAKEMGCKHAGWNIKTWEKTLAGLVIKEVTNDISSPLICSKSLKG